MAKRISSNLSLFEYVFAKVNLFSYVDLWHRTIRNWYAVLLFKLGIKRTVTLKLRYGEASL